MSKVTDLLSKVNELSADEKNELVIEVFKGYNLLQIKQFKDLFCKVFDVSAAAPMVAAVATGASTEAKKVEEKVEPTEFNVIITDAGANKINVIKSVRAITNLGLKEAKQLVDTAPQPVKEKVSKEEAMKIKEELEKAGAKIDMKGIV